MKVSKKSIYKLEELAEKLTGGAYVIPPPKNKKEREAFDQENSRLIKAFIAKQKKPVMAHA